MTRFSPTTSLRLAFTLIELMVVIAIIVVLVAVSIPAINAMTKGNDVAQSQNMLSGLIANARAIAISQGRMAALVLYEEGSGAGKPAPQTSAMFLVEDRNPSTPPPGVPAGYVRFWPVPNATAQRLPLGAKIASFSTDAAGNSIMFADPVVQATVPGNTNLARVVVFDDSGQLVLRSGIAVDSNSTDMTNNFTKSLTASQVASWQKTFVDFHLVDLNTTPPAAAVAKSVSAPALAVYSDEEFRRDNPSGTSPDLASAWIVSHCKVLAINTYTGTVIQ